MREDCRGFKELTRTPLEGTKYQVTVTTAGGLKTTYETTPDTGAGEGKRVTAPDGTVSTSVHFRDGSSTSTAANGTKTSVVTGGDARYGTMSIRLVVNASTGGVAQRIDFDAWGVAEKDTSPGFQPFGYAGGLYDSDTGLVRFGARDYDAATGVWLEREPLAQSPSYLVAMARSGSAVPIYAYAVDSPIYYIDPDGLGQEAGRRRWRLPFGSGLSSTRRAQ